MNRIKQLIWAITSKYKNIDQNVLDKYLSNTEKKEFLKLNKVEQHHSIRVCKDCIEYINLNETNINQKKMAKIALLHDIGKQYKSLNIFQKSITVILDKITNGKMRNYTKIKIFDVYYNHGSKGKEILMNIGSYDEEILQAVNDHHLKQTSNNIYLQILREMDDRN